MLIVSVILILLASRCGMLDVTTQSEALELPQLETRVPVSCSAPGPLYEAVDNQCRRDTNALAVTSTHQPGAKLEEP
jgi:hypothetical protein